MRAFAELWDELCRERYGVDRSEAAPVPLRRAGQLARPHRAAAREQRLAHPDRGARRTLSRDARCRALQLPTWNEALSLPRPWDQQWSLRLQQILAYETDLLEYRDLFDGSTVGRAQQVELIAGREAELARIERAGRHRGAIESRLMKRSSCARWRAHGPHRDAASRSSSARNKWTEGLPSPLVGGDDGGVFRHGCRRAARPLARLAAHARDARRRARVERAGAARATPRATASNLMEASIECALARSPPASGPARCAPCWASTGPRPASTASTLALERRRSRRCAPASRLTRRARPPAAAAGRQAGPRRALQRRRGDRGRGAARRLRGHLRRHPARPAAIAQSGRRRRTRRRRPLGPVRLAPRARRASCSTRSRPRAPARSRSWSAASCRPATRPTLTAMGVGAVFTPRDYDLVDVMDRIVDLIDA